MNRLVQKPFFDQRITIQSQTEKGSLHNDRSLNRVLSKSYSDEDSSVKVEHQSSYSSLHKNFKCTQSLS